MDSSTHNSLAQQIGNIYHYYIVVDKLFSLEDGQKLIVEVYGDITKASIYNTIFLENYEIKHHEGNDELSYSSEDFWKTIKNWINDSDKYSDQTKLILCTTSKLNSDLLNFESKTEEKKIELLQSWQTLTTNKKIQEHTKTIFADENILKKVLSKINFIQKHDDFSAIKECIIKDHKDYFDTFENQQNKLRVLVELLGSTIGEIKDKNNWEIDFDTFIKIRNDIQKKNLPKSIIVEQSDISHINDANVQGDISGESLYIKKLREISLDDEHILWAAKHKHMAINFANKLMDNSIGYYTQKLEACKDVFISHWSERKIDFDSTQSKDFYKEIIADKEKLCLHDEDRTQSFKKGFWHILADDEKKPKQIYWLLEDKE